MEQYTSKGNYSTAALLIGFNRVDFLRNRLSELSRNQQIPIFISIDGSDSVTEKSISRFLEDFISMNPKMNIQFQIQEENLGLTHHITGAVSNVLKNYCRVIVIEDDIVLSDTFIHNMITGLALLDKMPEFGVVCGFSAFKSVFVVDSPIQWRASCYFSPWGWATNSKQWEKYRVEVPKEFQRQLESSAAWNSLSKPRRDLWASRFAKVQSGNPHTWDFQAQYFLFKNELKALHLTKRISDNQGFNRKDSTNTRLQRPKWMGKIMVSNSIAVMKLTKVSKFYEAVDALTVGGDDRIFRTIRRLPNLSRKKHK